MPAALPVPSKASNTNFDWIVSHFDKLVLRHPNCWIAVDQGKVLAADPDLGVVRKAAGRSQSTDVVYFFVDDGSLIFWSQ